MKLVSAVMPCRGRVEYSRLAVESFLSQTYQNRELVILDDFDKPGFPNGIAHPLIRYYQTENIVFNIPTKRNRVNWLAKGEIICHFDSDDFSAPDRMAQQVAHLEASGKAVVGYHKLLFHESSTGLVFEYHARTNYALGTSLCYRKWWWELNKFPDNVPVGSDNRFVFTADRAKQLECVEGGSMIVARIHADNTSKKHNRGTQYRPVGLERLPEGFLVGAAV